MRNIKKLALLAFTALALVAFVGTATAGAKGAFIAGAAGQALSTSTIEDHVLAVTGSDIECETVSFSGVTQSKEFYPAQPVVPTYSGCTAFGFANATIDTNGCEFTFKATTDANSKATVNLHGCGTGTAEDKTKGIQTTVKIPFIATCIVDVPEQSVASAVTYWSGGADDFAIEMAMSGIMVDVTTSTGLCPLTTGTHSGGNGGTYTGESTITAPSGITFVSNV